MLIEVAQTACSLKGVNSKAPPAFRKLSQYVHLHQGLLLQEMRAGIISEASARGMASGAVAPVRCAVQKVLRGGSLVRIDVQLRLSADAPPPRSEDLLVLRTMPEGAAGDDPASWFCSDSRLVLVSDVRPGPDETRPVVTLLVKLVSCAASSTYCVACRWTSTHVSSGMWM